jgi:hypothetical protein
VLRGLRRIGRGLAAALPARFGEELIRVSAEFGEGLKAVTAAIELPRTEPARFRAGCRCGEALRSARLRTRRSGPGTKARQQQDHHSQPEGHSEQELHGPRRSLATSSARKTRKAFLPETVSRSAQPPDALLLQMMQRPGTWASGGAASLPNADSQPNGSTRLPGGWSCAGASVFSTAVTLFVADRGLGTERCPPVLPVGKSTTSSGALVGLESRCMRAGTRLSSLRERFTLIAGSASSLGDVDSSKSGRRLATVGA